MFPFHYLPVSTSRQIAVMQRKGSRAERERRTERARCSRGDSRRKVEVRAPHERAPALRVVLRLAATSSLLCSFSLYTVSSSSSSSRRHALLSSTGINLGRLHLYLMLPISRLIPSAYSFSFPHASLYSLY